MKARVAVLVFPGTNSEAESCDLLLDCGADARIVHWSEAASLAYYDAFVLPGGFAYEDRIRAGAIAAHDAMLDVVIEGAQAGKLVMGICNGAQILLEAGLAPGSGEIRRPTAAFAHNAQGHFICERVLLRRSAAAERCAIAAALPEQALIPAWAAHGQGRLAASPAHLDELERGGYVVFRYADIHGATDAHLAPQGSALGAAALTNREGNVLAIMPHPERDAWNFNHPDRSEGADILAPSGGSVLFKSFVTALERM
ncbi:MAG: phosphoribosylformylglycinamidine synthase I [Candidatus Eremiobacteraeota bacterium]|nr:phosphoribosylformylglycinamidine synthase I [Candidatus Eremiobacteraeota bacterium]